MYSLVGLRDLVGPFIIGLSLYPPEEIENKIDSILVTGSLKSATAM